MSQILLGFLHSEYEGIELDLLEVHVRHSDRVCKSHFEKIDPESYMLNPHMNLGLHYWKHTFHNLIFCNISYSDKASFLRKEPAVTEPDNVSALTLGNPT
ncbi:Leucine-Rich Repeat-Containing Protein 28 [Manis pentadactyla]|nr:Leucine-Rich Repeat-Containing Protein 28 [Manis pentadactyla]